MNILKKFEKKILDEIRKIEPERLAGTEFSVESYEFQVCASGFSFLKDEEKVYLRYYHFAQWTRVTDANVEDIEWFVLSYPKILDAAKKRTKEHRELRLEKEKRKSEALNNLNNLMEEN